MSKFLELSHFEQSIADGYRLLPFRFSHLEGQDYVISNQAGEFLVVDRITLDRFVHHALLPTEEAYENLKSKHFLADKDSSIAFDLLALKVRTKLRRLKNFTGLHIFVVSLRCEHSCPYCQVSRQSDNVTAFDMSEDIANKAIDLVFRSPARAIKIEFQGGEPLLNFSLIEYIVLEAKRKNITEQRDLKFVIATNLALISDPILDFCRQHEILISTSLDGPADLHNHNRPRPGGDSYFKAIDGIRRAREALGANQVSALMTTTKGSLNRVTEIIDEYIAQGFRSIFLRPLSPYGFAVKTKWISSYDGDDWLDFYFHGLEYIIDLNRNGYAFTEFYAATILAKLLTPFEPGFVDLRSPAGIGIAAVVYNYDGDVYASDEGRMLAEMGDKTFRLGNVDTDSYAELFLSDALLDPLEESFAASAPMCVDCAFEPYCGSDPVFHHATQGDFVGRKPISKFCSRNMAIIKRLISLMQSDDWVRELFVQWANALC